MCGRFVFMSGERHGRLLETIEQDLPGITGLSEFKKDRGDVYPSQLYPVIREGETRPEVEIMQWGYLSPSKKRKGLLINARAETAAEKYTFRDDFRRRRCIVAATGFYEWDACKNKVLFDDETGLLFIGGLYTPADYDEKNKADERFVILTKSPDATVKAVHNRMPVLIPHRCAHDWLTDPAAAEEIIHNYSVALKSSGQQRLI